MTFLWSGLRMKDALCSDLLSTCKSLFVSFLGLLVNFRNQIEGKKFKLALATFIDVKIQALLSFSRSFCLSVMVIYSCLFVFT